jgi:CRISPR-associated protein Cas5d
MNGYGPLEVKVWGDLACFTRPEMKVERVSYTVMTPSAARGVLEAIFWKPEFRWLVREIMVLNPMSHFSILRNEVNHRVSAQLAQKRIAGGVGYFAEEEQNRAQRNTLALRDVCYIIRADVEVRPEVKDNAAKFRDQFRRRVARGQCFHQPYLGCREFVAYFGPPGAGDRPIDRSSDLGRMLFDLEYSKDGKGRGEPRFFDAQLEAGVLSVPPALYTKGD